MKHSATVAPTIPVAVQVGFGGSRDFFVGMKVLDDERRELEAQLLALLTDVLRRLPEALGMSKHHFLCGVSQVAIGADALFTQACATLAIPQRVLLPQEKHAYLEAADSDGTPDFNAAQRQHAIELLQLPHVVEERVVSDSSERSDQFVDANLAISRTADVIIGIVRRSAKHKVGGTFDLIERAASLGKPALIMEVAIEGDKALMSPLLPVGQWLNGQGFVAPGIPGELKGVGIEPVDFVTPDVDAYLQTIGREAGERSKAHSSLFKRGALTVLIFHVAATLLATFANKFHDGSLASALLFTELACLGAGLGAHLMLHKGHAVHVWAVTRLVAQMMTSLQAVRAAGGSLGYAVLMTWEEEFLPLLRTCTVLHLMQTRQQRCEPTAKLSLEARRDAYCRSRIEEDGLGQLHYYRKQARQAKYRRKVATVAFWIFSLGAVMATSLKWASLHGWLGNWGHHMLDWGGFFAIILPVIAVGFLSWSGASDLEARAATFSAMSAFLERQLPQLRAATSDHELDTLVRETETRLLGESHHWFSRRSFTDVT
ncbi:hypothetical protein [Variovorax sp. RCC_210]|uniref:hypothetical protein n=1 Tax=Variovorax sp. RCC_210 TaxID=3239217 RepID=UPI003523AFB2